MLDGHLDGEPFHGRDRLFTLCPALLPLLSRP
jgi:hypothetical protein